MGGGDVLWNFGGREDMVPYPVAMAPRSLLYGWFNAGGWWRVTSAHSTMWPGHDVAALRMVVRLLAFSWAFGKRNLAACSYFDVVSFNFNLAPPNTQSCARLHDQKATEFPFSRSFSCPFHAFCKTPKWLSRVLGLVVGILLKAPGTAGRLHVVPTACGPHLAEGGTGEAAASAIMWIHAGAGVASFPGLEVAVGGGGTCMVCESLRGKGCCRPVPSGSRSPSLVEWVLHVFG